MDIDPYNWISSLSSFDYDGDAKIVAIPPLSLQSGRGGDLDGDVGDGDGVSRCSV